MATRRASSFDDKRARIAALASSPPALAAAELRRYLGDKNGYLCGEAAAVAQKLELREVIADMTAAFERLLVDGATSDKGCFGKKRILEALLAFEADVPSVYLAGIRCIQLEPAFGKPADTAVPVRTLSAHALVQIDHHDALLEVAPLLADPEPLVRAEAARALARTGIDAASALLHLKALSGDAEPDVIAACYEGLLRLAPRRYLSIVGAALCGDDESRTEVAALALGASRLAEALPLLSAALGRAASPRERQSVITAIALHRSDEAIALLLSLVEAAPEAQAAAAIDALALHRHDAAIVERLRAAVAGRGSRRLADALRDRFDR